jgi:chaperonin GroES
MRYGFATARSTMIKPLGDRVLVKPLLAEAKTKGGIFIPDTAKEAPAQGEIVALGNGKIKEGKTHTFSVAKGDKVLYSKYAGDEIRIDGADYKIMREEEILGIL